MRVFAAGPVAPALPPAESITHGTPYDARNAWNACGKGYAFYNGSPGAAANNCYAFRSFFYGFLGGGYDAAKPR